MPGPHTVSAGHITNCGFILAHLNIYVCTCSWMVGCALATGLPLALITYACSFYIWQLGRYLTM